MITTITLGILLSTAQNAAPSFTPLGRPATREAQSVLLVQRGASVRFEVSTLWVQKESHDFAEQPSTGGGRKFSVTPDQYNTLFVNQTGLEAALTGIAILETPVEMQLPRDGRLMVVWDRQTGVIDVQMAASAVVVPEGETLACPQVSGRAVGFMTTTAPKASGVWEGDKLRTTQHGRPDDPTSRLSSFPMVAPNTLEEVMDGAKPAQVALGYFDLQATGQRVDDAPQYRFSLSTWLNQPAQRDLCVAKSADGARWYIWFEGEM